MRKHCEIAALTRSEKGSVVVNGDEVHVIDAVKGVKVVDTTGAGDAYAAGFLYAYTQGPDLKTAGKLGGAMAAQVISQYGPRAEKAEILKLKASGGLARPAMSHRSNDSRRPTRSSESRSASGRVETSPAARRGCSRRRS